jgi:hypothetical protein
MIQEKKLARSTFMADLIKVLQNTKCQVCYGSTEVIDSLGTWCERCHREFTNGIINPARRISLVDLMKKYREDWK